MTDEPTLPEIHALAQTADHNVVANIANIWGSLGDLALNIRDDLERDLQRLADEWTSQAGDRFRDNVTNIRQSCRDFGEGAHSVRSALMRMANHIDEAQFEIERERLSEGLPEFDDYPGVRPGAVPAVIGDADEYGGAGIGVIGGGVLGGDDAGGDVIDGGFGASESGGIDASVGVIGQFLGHQRSADMSSAGLERAKRRLDELDDQLHDLMALVISAGPDINRRH
ncbi:hypothetical protein O7635_24690 [Asanoa sp. WMMD1127]|uniref:WXG100 family type VII secretion target n=1 Tax=Asanoa sp. WMMD1127 TaxID=3016107 RepID=UPI002416FCDD|nr:hypothetical protein [Asanoa sp. WMMD1127]MDG4825059.1 hypothetical protein [Asanoa sp. WMMD1127]